MAIQSISEEVAANGFEQLCVKAGDMLVVPEALTHCVLPWVPTDRKRRVLMLRFQPQYMAGAYRLFASDTAEGNGRERGEQSNGAANPFPIAVRERLHPHTLELTQCAHFTHVKGVATRAVVTLDEEGDPQAVGAGRGESGAKL